MSDDPQMNAAIVGGLIGALVGCFGTWILGNCSWLVYKWWTRPIIVVEFANSDDCVARFDKVRPSFGPIPRTPHQIVYARVRIRSVGVTWLTDCRAWLVGIERFDAEAQVYRQTVFQESVPLIFSYSPQLESIQVPENVVRHFDLIKLDTLYDQVEPQIKAMAPDVYEGIEDWVYRPIQFRDLFRTQGRLRYRIVVTADGAKPAFKEIEFTWFPGQPPTFIFSSERR